MKGKTIEEAKKIIETFIEMIKREEKNEEKFSRRGRFYSISGKKYRPRPRFYIFSDDDLRNPEVLQRVEDVPTSKRTAEYLKQIKEVSNTNY